MRKKKREVESDGGERCNMNKESLILAGKINEAEIEMIWR